MFNSCGPASNGSVHTITTGYQNLSGHNFVCTRHASCIYRRFGATEIELTFSLFLISIAISKFLGGTYFALSVILCEVLFLCLRVD